MNHGAARQQGRLSPSWRAAPGPVAAGSLPGAGIRPPCDMPAAAARGRHAAAVPVPWTATSPRVGLAMWTGASGPVPCESSCMRKYVIMGIQGSGKGTHAKMLAEGFDLEHIAVGDIFRWNVQHH